MKEVMNSRKLNVALVATCVVASFIALATERTQLEGAKLHRFSTTVEKERPQLDGVTKSLIGAYRRNPNEANRTALEVQVGINYDKVLARKKAKLEELRREAGPEKVKEMEDIVNEMIAGRETRIRQSMARFTDVRFKPGVRTANDGYHAVLGAPNVAIAHSPVTVGEYAEFRKTTKKSNRSLDPVANVSLADAEDYCKWLTMKDDAFTYRLPTAEEWEIAAGHMPKDADFETIEGACGAIGFWGHIWQLTSTKVGDSVMVKGGAKDSPRTRCRTEIRDELRLAKNGYDNVGFRVVREPKERPSTVNSQLLPVPNSTSWLP